MNRPAAVIGISMLISLIFLILTESAYSTAVFCILLALCIITAVSRHFSGWRGMAFLITASFVFSCMIYAGSVKCSLLPSKLLCGEVCEIEGTAADFCSPDTADGNTCVLRNCRINGTATKTDITVCFDEGFTCEPYDVISASVRLQKDYGDELWELYGNPLLSGTAENVYSVVSPKHRGITYYPKYCALKASLIIESCVSEEASSVINALLLGNSDTLTASFKTALRISGASHIFAVSGMHLSLWSALLFLVMRKASRTKIIPNIAAILFVLFFIVFTGFSSSVLRAGIMLITVYLGFCFKQPADALNSLGLAAIILLTVNPVTAVNVSFLLSFTATAALFTLYPFFERNMNGIKRHFRTLPLRFAVKIFNTVIMSLCVILFTAPVSGAFFGTVSLLSPVSSVLLTPLVELLMVTSAFAVFLSPLQQLSQFFFGISSYCAKSINALIEWLAEYDFAVCRIEMKFLLYFYIISAVIVVSVYISSKNKIQPTVSAICVCALVLVSVGIATNTVENNKTCIRIFPDGNVLAYSGLGDDSLLIYSSEDTDGVYEISSFMQKNVITHIDTLLFPYTCDSTADIQSYTTGFFPSDNILSEASVEYGITYGDMQCEGYSHSDLSSGIITASDIKTVYCFNYSADFSALGNEYTYGDILICRNEVPKGLDSRNFGKIIIISDYGTEESDFPENSVSTADTGAITVSIDKRRHTYALN